MLMVLSLQEMFRQEMIRLPISFRQEMRLLPIPFRQEMRLLPIPFRQEMIPLPIPFRQEIILLLILFRQEMMLLPIPFDSYIQISSPRNSPNPEPEESTIQNVIPLQVFTCSLPISTLTTQNAKGILFQSHVSHPQPNSVVSTPLWWVFKTHY